MENNRIFIFSKCWRTNKISVECLGRKKCSLFTRSRRSIYKNDTRYGHGVGISQVGAQRFIANDNYNFIDVLTYYYTNVTLNRLYN